MKRDTLLDMFWGSCIDWLFCYLYYRNEDDHTIGQITSVAVNRSYRRLGLAQKLMRQSQIKMVEVYNCKTCTLHVRESNYAARHMYEDVLGFKLLLFTRIMCRLADVDVKYYADGENGLSLKLDLDLVRKEYNLSPFKGLDPERDSPAETASESTKKTQTKKNRKGRKFYAC